MKENLRIKQIRQKWKLLDVYKTWLDSLTFCEVLKEWWLVIEFHCRVINVWYYSLFLAGAIHDKTITIISWMKTERKDLLFLHCEYEKVCIFCTVHFQKCECSLRGTLAMHLSPDMMLCWKVVTYLISYIKLKNAI